jgi:hypothetical protein
VFNQPEPPSSSGARCRTFVSCSSPASFSELTGEAINRWSNPNASMANGIRMTKAPHRREGARLGSAKFIPKTFLIAAVESFLPFQQKAVPTSHCMIWRPRPIRERAAEPCGITRPSNKIDDSEPIGFQEYRPFSSLTDIH